LGKTSNLAGRKAKSLALSARERGLLRRFLTDWIRPRWRQIALALLFTGGLAAATAGYPLIIKSAFDSLMQAGSFERCLGC
jgi:subfamily B ATP-binding cassette protein MsbA